MDEDETAGDGWVHAIPWNNRADVLADSSAAQCRSKWRRSFRTVRPIRMVWQREDCRVVRSWGPERIATGWWRAEDVERDYYRAEWEDGTQVWVYRDQRNGRWFLHGFFD